MAAFVFRSCLFASKRQHWQSYIFIDGKTFFSDSTPVFLFLLFLSFDCLLVIAPTRTSDANTLCAIVFAFFCRWNWQNDSRATYIIIEAHVATPNNNRVNKRKKTSSSSVAAIYDVCNSMAMTISPVYNFQRHMSAQHEHTHKQWLWCLHKWKTKTKNDMWSSFHWDVCTYSFTWYAGDK